jgi:hypothetical protein
MKLGQFVTTSSVVLAGWLGFTFVHEVPSQRYPKLQKYTDALPHVPAPDMGEPMKAISEAEVFHVSVSH